MDAATQAGWNFYYHNAGGGRVAATGTTQASINNSTGSPTTAAPVASGATATEANGLFRTRTAPVGPAVMLTTEPASLDISSVLWLQWVQGNQSANTVLRPLIQIGGVTYVADTGSTNPAVSSSANFAAGALPRVFILAGQTWKTLQFVDGQPMTLGTGAATLPATGIITAVGLYWDIDSNIPVRVDTFEIVTHASNGLQAWRETYFGQWTNSGIAANRADPDADGVANLVEYATGTAPDEVTPSAAADLDPTGQHLTLAFTRIADPSLTYTAETTPNLASGTWNPIWTSTGPENIAAPVVITDPVSLAVQSRQFLRLRINTPVSTVVSGPWSGNITPTSVTVNAEVSSPSVEARLVVATDPAFTAPVYGTTVTSLSTTGNAVRLDVSGLAPDTDYHYALELDGEIDRSAGRTGRFRTAPVGAASYTFGFASCGTGTNAAQYTYTAIQNDAPRFFLHTGDLNYFDTNSADPAAYRANYRSVLGLAELGALFRSLPIAYVWDDHDYAGNDSNRTAKGRTAHRQVYRERVPHYPLAAGPGEAPIYQSFDYGRVRFLVTDLRSERDPAANTDNATKTMMGTAQKAWFKEQLLRARNDEVRLIAWVCSVPFLSSATTQDNWGSYTTERSELADFMAANHIRNVAILSGDMHGLAYDDGTNSDFSTGGLLPDADHPKIFQAAAMAQTGSLKGGPYSGGYSTGAGRYGLFTIADTGGDTIQATYTGRIATSATAVTNWATYTFTTRAPVPRAPGSLTVGNSSGGLAVQWTDLSGVETGYRIERSTDGTTGWTTIATTPANSSSHLDPAVPPGETRFYRVIPVNSAGDGIASSVHAGTM